MVTITYHPEKDFGYQWKMKAKDSLSTSIICFETQQEAEQYVIMCMLYYGKVI